VWVERPRGNTLETDPEDSGLFLEVGEHIDVIGKKGKAPRENLEERGGPASSFAANLLDERSQNTREKKIRVFTRSKKRLNRPFPENRRRKEGERFYTGCGKI